MKGDYSWVAEWYHREAHEAGLKDWVPFRIVDQVLKTGEVRPRMDDRNAQPRSFGLAVKDVRRAIDTLEFNGGFVYRIRNVKTGAIVCL